MTPTELEAVKAPAREAEAALSSVTTRRAIAAQDVPMSHLVGQRFRAGRRHRSPGVRHRRRPNAPEAPGGPAPYCDRAGRRSFTC